MKSTRFINEFLSAIMVMGFIFTASFTQANEFAIGEAGDVKAGGVTFSSISDYVESDYFKEKGMRCGTKPPEGVEDETLAKSTAHCTATLTSLQGEYWPTTLYYSIPVWWHVIYSSSGAGNISEARINAQIEVLNEDYRAIANTMGSNSFDVKIQFELKGITRTMNDSWFNDNDEYGYKTALGKDTNQFMNVYSNTASGYLGYAYFPQSGGAGSWYDGVVMLHEAVGGRNNGFSQYDQGRTMVHEVGHYLGLYHTFQGGCTNSYSSGDLIVDTNAEETAHYTCDQTTTCGNADPIHNYMNYTDDDCMTQFTREQANRTVCSMVNYRPSLFSTISTVDPETGAITLPPVLMPLILK